MQLKFTNNLFVYAGACAALCAGTSLYAQQSNRLAGTVVLSEHQETHLPAFIDFQQGHQIRQTDFANWAGTALNLPASSVLQPYSVDSDDLGFTHTRYKQYLNGVPVEGSMVITHAKNGVIESVNGDYYVNFQAGASRAPSISEQAALKLALNKVNAKTYMWENKAVEESVRAALQKPDFSYAPKGELVVVHKENTDYSASNMVLAYKFNIFAEQPFTRQNIFVDAITGEVVATMNLLHAADETGTANTLYSGTRTITSNKSGSTYTLTETSRGKGINTKTWSQKANITGTSNNWNITNNDRYGLDAHWGAEMSYDYYKTMHNRNSLDDKGILLLSYIHNSDNMNAYWTGDYMLYGDGNGNDVKPFAALDVCGHELTHGVITHSANLAYSYESGALNEGFADIFGTCVEAFARPGANEHNWIMGKDFTTNNAWQRSLADPKAHKNPDTYKGTNWATGSGDNGGVHTNSGPIGHWFYLLSDGGKGTNDINNAYDITGVGIEKAGKIAYRALTSYMTTNTNYAGARTAAIKAATDLYGTCSPELHATIDAFYAIGVGDKDQASVPTSAFSADKTTACTLPVTVKFTNTSSNATTYKWDFGDGTTSTDKDPSHEYTKAGSYTVKLTVSGGTCANGSDDEIKTSYIVINGDPVAAGAERCGPGALTLTATGAGTLNWYDSPSATTSLGTGPSYTIPNITATTTYYVTSTSGTPAVTGGPTSATSVGANGAFDNSTDRYLIFDVLANTTLKTVDVQADAAGTRKIELRNSSGTVITSKDVNIAAGVSTITLDFPLTTGTGYQLAVNGTANLYRNTAGAQFPYTIGSAVKITGTNYTSAGYYYYFYKWVLGGDLCVSKAVPVVANIEVCTGVDEPDANTGIEVYPNPATTLLNLKATQTIHSFAIVDMLGKVVMQDNSIKKNNIQLDVNGLPAGVYFVRVNTLDTQRVIKIIKE